MDREYKDREFEAARLSKQIFTKQFFPQTGGNNQEGKRNEKKKLQRREEDFNRREKERKKAVFEKVKKNLIENGEKIPNCCRPRIHENSSPPLQHGILGKNFEHFGYQF